MANTNSKKYPLLLLSLQQSNADTIIDMSF